MFEILDRILGNRQKSRSNSSDNVQRLKSLKTRSFRFEPLEERQLLSFTATMPQEISQTDHILTWELNATGSDQFQPGDQAVVYWDVDGDGAFEPDGDDYDGACQAGILSQTSEKIIGNMNQEFTYSTAIMGGSQNFFVGILRGGNYIAAPLSTVTLTNSPDFFQFVLPTDLNPEDPPYADAQVIFNHDRGSDEVYPNFPLDENHPFKTFWFDNITQSSFTINAWGYENGVLVGESMTYDGLDPMSDECFHKFIRVDVFDSNGSIILNYRPVYDPSHPRDGAFTKFMEIHHPKSIWERSPDPYIVYDPKPQDCCGASPVDGAPVNAGIGVGETNPLFESSSLPGLVYSNRALTNPSVGTVWSSYYYNYFYPDSMKYFTGVAGKMQKVNSFSINSNPSTEDPTTWTAAAFLYDTVNTSSLSEGHYIFGVLANAHQSIPQNHYNPPYSYMPYWGGEEFQSCQGWGAVDVISSSSDDGFGAGWSYKSLDRLDLLEGSDLHRDILLITGDQNTIFFDDNGDQTYDVQGMKHYVKPYGTHRQLVRMEDGTYRLKYNPDGLDRIFNDSGQLMRLEDQLGNVVETFGYNGNGYLEAITDREGKQTEFVYALKTFSGSASKTLLDHINTPDGLAIAFDYTYDGAKYLVSSIRKHDQANSLSMQDSPTWSFAYNINHVMSSSADPLNSTVQYSYNTDNQLISKEYATGAIRSYAIDYTPYLEHSWTYGEQYERPMRWRGTWTDQLGNEGKWTFDKKGLLIGTLTLQDASGQVTKVYYDPQGDLYKVSVDPDGDGPICAQITEYSYDEFGNITAEWRYSESNPSAILSYESWTYDSVSNRLTNYVDPQQISTQYTYSMGTGYTIRTTTVAGNVTNEYLSSADSTNYLDSLGQIHDYSKLPADTVLKRIDSLGHTTEYIYDSTIIGGVPASSYGQLVKTVAAAETSSPSVTKYEYDIFGNQIAVIDELNRRTDSFYDALNRLVKTVGPYRVDNSGNAILKDAIVDNPASSANWTSATGGYGGSYLSSTTSGATVSWTFDNLTLGKQYALLVTWVPDSQNTTDAPYSVAGGDLIAGTFQAINQKLSPSDSVLGSRWQKRGVYQTTGTGTSITVTLTNNGGRMVADAVRLVEVPTSGAMEYRNETDYEYDKLGNQTAIIDAMGRRTEMVYDPVSGAQSIVTGIDPDGTGPKTSPITYYGYDLAFRSAYTVDPLGKLSTCEYDALGRETKTFQGSLVDNGSASAFQTSGTWNTLASNGFGGSSIYAAGVSGTPTATAKWTFNNLVSDREYEIVLTWTKDGSGTYATNAPFTISYIDQNGTPQQTTIAIDQTKNLFEADDPNTPTNELLSSEYGNHLRLGKGWSTISTIHIKGTQITVSLTNLANGRVAADAVVVYDTTPTSQTSYDGFGNIATTTDALGNVTYHAYDAMNRSVADFTKAATVPDADDDSRYSQSGDNWTTIAAEDTYRIHATDSQSTPSATASWSSADVLKKGKVYEILVSWQIHRDADTIVNSQNAPFDIYEGSVGGTPLATFLVDQSKTPDAAGKFYFIDGRYYRSIGTYSVSADNAPLIVQLRSNTYENSKVVVADDVCFAEVTNSSQSIYNASGQTLASIDPLGRISATQYDDQSQPVQAYKGLFLDNDQPGFFASNGSVGYTDKGVGGTYRQIGHNEVASWSFNNVSYTKNVPFDLYVYAPHYPDIPTPSNYSIRDDLLNDVFSADSYPAESFLGDGWYKIGTVNGAFHGTTLTLHLAGDYSGVYADAVCLLQKSAETIFDSAGQITSTIDVLGHVTMNTYDAHGRPTATQQGSIIDDGDGESGGFVTAGGNWSTSSNSSYYKESFSYSDTTESYAKWIYKNLTPSNGGNYEIYVSSYPGDGSQYQILDENDNPLSSPIFSFDTSSATPLGGSWYKLGNLLNYIGKKIAVQLNNVASYYADAVCLVQTMSKVVYNAGGQTTAGIDPLGRVSVPVEDSLGRQLSVQQGMIVDDGDTAFSTMGSWSLNTIPSAYQRDYRLGNASGATATWTFNHLTPGDQYEIDLSWVADTSNTPNASYAVTGGALVSGTQQTINQTSTPTHPSLGTGWQRYAVYTADSSGTITVSLAYNGTGSVVADAACLIDITPRMYPEFDANGNVLASYDAAGNKTVYQYDSAGQLLKTIAPDADGSTTTISDQPVSQTIYNAGGAATASITPYGTSPAYGVIPVDPMYYLYRTVTGYDYDYLGRQIDTKKGVMVDNTEASTSFSKTSTLWTQNSGGGYEGQYLSAPGMTGTTPTATATWTFNNLLSGRQYEIVVSWTADAANTNNAPYAITGGTLVSGTGTTINQRITPTHSILGTGWQRLGIYQASSSSTPLTVTLRNNNNSTGNVVADAVCLIEVTPTASSTYDAAGNVVSSTDAMGRTTTYEYDSLSQLVKTTMPDADGNSSTQTDIPVYKYAYDAAGQLVESRQGAYSGTTDLVTAYRYDYLGRRTATLSSDPTTGAASENRMQRSEYDLLGNLRYQYDALGNQTEYVYDAFGRLTDKYDPDPDGLPGGLDRPHTAYTYDAAGERLTLTDPASTTTYPNITAWTYDYLGRTVEEKVYESPTTTYSTYYSYNASGDLAKKVDRESRETVYTYDHLHRQTTESWMSGGSAARTTAYTYDTFGRTLTVTDRAGTTAVGADYAYTYDWYGNNTASAATIAGLTPVVNLTQLFDVAGNRLQLNAKLGASQTFVNQYRYDRLNRTTEVSQGATSGGGYSSIFSTMALKSSTPGTTITNKLVDFTYDAYGRMTTIERYENLNKTAYLARTVQTYDKASRLTGIATNMGSYIIGYSGGWSGSGPTYSWTYDNADKVATFTSPDSATATSYTYDDDNQLTGADYAYQTDEAYAYDENGNRTSTSGTYLYQTGAMNRITQDTLGNTYDYDHEGNRIRKTASNNLSKVEYAWDYRNRLTGVTNYSRTNANNPWTQGQTITYSYDAFNRKVGKTVDNTPIGSIDSREAYAYDGQNPVLFFKGSGSGVLAATALKHVMLYGPAVDQVLADDTISSSTASTRWMLADNEGTIRDVVKNWSGSPSVSGGGTIADHLKYDAFGNITGQTYSSEQPRFTYTGRELDADTGLYYYRARWYDAKTGKFISQDPMSFNAGDENLYRYVGNNPTNATDPTGMWKIERPSEESQKPNRVKVCGRKGDTVWSLARIEKLDPKQYQVWLKPVGEAKLPNSPSQPLTTEQAFTVPNVIGVFYAKLSPVPDAAKTVCTTQAILTSAGYEIKGYKIKEADDGKAKSFRDLFQNIDTVGFVFAGHGGENTKGNPSGLVIDSSWSTGDMAKTVKPSQVVRPFSLAFLDLYACRSAEKVDDGMYWATHLSPHGEFIGGIGDIGVAPWQTQEWTIWYGPNPPASIVAKMPTQK